ncbi:DUF4234 domain-containing protein [Allohahella sp. A8]|uniref:DUF4234 domain-containing protein n=1 Tax=Allohahella sp. A8 TaxID=3141461 RepID=UPI003A80FBD8
MSSFPEDPESRPDTSTPPKSPANGSTQSDSSRESASENGRLEAGENNTSNEPPHQDKGPGIAVFNSFSVWYVLGLTILTQGLYFMYWHWHRSKKLNEALPENPISSTFINNVVAAYIVYIGLVVYASVYFPEALQVPEGATVESLAAQPLPGVWVAVQIFGNIVLILTAIWSYKIRNRLNQLLAVEKGQPLWSGPILAVLFQAFYLQWKINKALETETNQLIRRF